MLLAINNDAVSRVRSNFFQILGVIPFFGTRGLDPVWSFQVIFDTWIFLVVRM